MLTLPPQMGRLARRVFCLHLLFASDDSPESGASPYVRDPFQIPTILGATWSRPNPLADPDDSRAWPRYAQGSTVLMLLASAGLAASASKAHPEEAEEEERMRENTMYRSVSAPPPVPLPRSNPLNRLSLGTPQVQEELAAREAGARATAQAPGTARARRTVMGRHPRTGTASAGNRNTSLPSPLCAPACSSLRQRSAMPVAALLLIVAVLSIHSRTPPRDPRAHDPRTRSRCVFASTLRTFVTLPRVAPLPTASLSALSSPPQGDWTSGGPSLRPVCLVHKAPAEGPLPSSINLSPPQSHSQKAISSNAHHVDHLGRQDDRRGRSLRPGLSHQRPHRLVFAYPRPPPMGNLTRR